MSRPSPADLDHARDRTIPDVIGPDLDVLFCGINPGLWSGALGQHFARPGNRFWPTLHRAGFTPRQLRPDEQRELLRYGLGVTNLATRTTARADELAGVELVAGAARLTALVAEYRPHWLAVLGVTAYRSGFARRQATVGRQEEQVAGAGVWVLPNPSGLNAHYQADALAAAYSELRIATGLRQRAALPPAASPPRRSAALPPAASPPRRSAALPPAASPPRRSAALPPAASPPRGSAALPD